jgi:beta-mannosidase
MARVAAARTLLDHGWEFAETTAGTARPEDGWRPARVPQTAASALGMTFDTARDLDRSDFWWRKRIARGETGDVLRFEGLATLADVWIDGEHTLRSESMFVEHAIDVARTLREGSELVMRFSSLAHALEARRARPRWRATIVDAQRLRFFRTSLLGRMPAWTPPIAPVGPYRAISVERECAIASADVRARVEGEDGIVDARLALRDDVRAVTLVAGESRAELTVDNGEACGAARVPRAPRWWPHTHGKPALLPVFAIARGARGEERIDFGATGFRTLEVDRAHGAFTLHVNGVRIFCRGASWMPLDVITLTDTRNDLRATLERVRDAGMNMLRVSGTTLYESHDFHELCDELGILVWQDFMFANMDYPIDDDGFRALVRAEATTVVDRLQLSPSLVVCCGGSEVEQQAAMMGVDASEWSNAMFRETLPAIVRDARPDVAYVASSPTTERDGALPFRVDEGISHYYGVGAYDMPLEDARRARVRFASECLAFANVPCDETIDAFMRDGESAPQHARWKARVARDRGTSWDFDDVRDRYVESIFGVDPTALRREDLARYVELARVATGEAMAAAMGEWRRARSECAGALVWFLRDLWEGAGFGVIDSRGMPKSPYFFLKRVLAPVALFATDEGTNGIALHAINDGCDAISASVSVALHRGEHAIARGDRAITIPPHGGVELDVDAIIGRFTDAAHAYRFGPPAHEVIVARLSDARSEVLARAFHFTRGLHDDHGSALIDAVATRTSERAWRLTVRAKTVARAIAIDARGWIAEDDFFDLEPGGIRNITLIARGPDAPPPQSVKPLNATRTRIACSP